MIIRGGTDSLCFASSPPVWLMWAAAYRWLRVSIETVPERNVYAFAAAARSESTTPVLSMLQVDINFCRTRIQLSPGISSTDHGGVTSIARHDIGGTRLNLQRKSG